jgi:hypothetical protein
MASANLIQTSVSGRTSNALAAQGDGLILPKLSSADRIALALTTSDAGLEVYDTTVGSPFWWTGAAWATSSSGPLYTQGIWNPTFSPATGSITLNPTSATGLWSKIGNTVTLVGRFRVQSISSPTGLLTLTNLPFPVVAGFESAACVAATGLNNGARTAISGTIFGLGLEIYHYESGTLQNMAVHVLVNSDWYISGTYITA